MEITPTSDVLDFVKRNSLEEEFKQVQNYLIDAFDNLGSATVELVIWYDDEDIDISRVTHDDSHARLVFYVKTDIERKQFRKSVEKFFAPLRKSGMRTYLLTVILRDFT